MSTNGHHPDPNGRDPLRADEWLEARHAASREQTSPFARGRMISLLVRLRPIQPECRHGNRDLAASPRSSPSRLKRRAMR